MDDSKGYLGIDVSKGYADFLLLDSSKKVVESNFQLTDTKDGRQVLGKQIARWKAEGLKELYCGVESTGGYENNWYAFLKGLQAQGGVFVCRLNPKGVKSSGDASLKRTITDSVSAEMIASYLLKFPEKADYGTSYVSDNGVKEGRQHLTSIRMLQKQKVQLSNQLEKLLYQYFSEILIYCRNTMPVWLLNLLIEYPTASLAREAGSKYLSKIKGISVDKAEAIIKKVKESDQIVNPQMAHLITMTAKEILHKEMLIRAEKLDLSSIYKSSEDVKLIVSMIGIGTDSAVIIALEIEDVTRFDTAGKFASYFGVHPTFKQSGDGMWGNHMSKKGRSEIRATLYMACLSGIRFNPVLRALYARFRAKGMTHRQATGVLMHKMLRMIYGILKSRKPFDPEIDKQNQEKAAEKQEEKKDTEKKERQVKKQSKHRFQPIALDAPISRRNHTERKKQITSQTSKEANAGSLPAEDKYIKNI
ncbi:MAG: IS110 family transposase [Rhabdochlamydiaceae bacterium]